MEFWIKSGGCDCGSDIQNFKQIKEDLRIIIDIKKIGWMIVI